MTTEKELAAELELREKEMNAMLQAVGQSVSDWGLVEEGLFELFFRLLATPYQGPASCTFIAAENVRTKIEMVNSMVRHSEEGRKHLAEWEELLKRCNKLRVARNSLVHRKTTTLKIGNARSQPALVGYKHDFRHLLEEEYGIPSHMGIARVKELSKEFRELSVDLVQFAECVPPPTT
jgi:hypothetical protein